jgi:integrase
MSFELISFNNYKANSQHTLEKKKCWTLFDTATAAPPICALVYSTLSLKRRAENTQLNSCTSIAQFYEYIESKFQKTVESFVFKHDILALADELTGFAEYLGTGRKAVNVVSLSQFEYVEKETYNIRLKAVGRFLHYLNERYTTRKYETFCLSDKEIRSKKLSVKFRVIEQLKDLAASKGTSVPRKYRSLTVFQTKVLVAVIYPHTPTRSNIYNPFKSSEVIFRNYLMCTVLLEYGLRRGELLLLTTTSFKQGIRESGNAIQYYLIVTTLEDEDEDFGKVNAKLKNQHAHRTLKITEAHYGLLMHYVKQVRPEADSEMLFLSSAKQTPLTTRMLNKIFKKYIFKAMCKVSPELLKTDSLEYLSEFTPHMLRHTWAVAMLFWFCSKEYAEKYGEDQIMSLESAQEKLRVLGGWSIKSEMPAHYGRRYIEVAANAANIARINEGVRING